LGIVDFRYEHTVKRYQPRLLHFAEHGLHLHLAEDRFHKEVRD
jgi:hypothetical protein